MDPTMQPFETRGHDLSGAASLEFHENESLNSFVSMMPGMDITRFEPVAIKIYLSGDNPLITLYARDKHADTKSSFPDDTFSVRKFKAPISWVELFKYVKCFDLVVNDGSYNLEGMRVDKK